MKFNASHRISLIIFVIAVFSHAVFAQQTLSRFERERGQAILGIIKSDLKQKYYDTSFHGMDLDKRFAEATEKMKTAASVGQSMGIIAQVLLELNDSHTKFVPPSRASRTEYGWKMQVIGQRAFVTAIKPKSDAEAKGLKVGDEVLGIDGYDVNRDTIDTLQYLYYTLRPQPGMKVTVKHVDGKQDELLIAAKITPQKRVMDLTGDDIWTLIREDENEDFLRRHRTRTLTDKVCVWKMPAFDLSETQIDDVMDKAGKYKALVIDLRGNGGGYVRTLNRLVGHFFDHDVKIADWKGRKEFDAQIAKSTGKDFFKGQVVALIDSESASAAEIFARVMQLEKRGTVLGDRSSGSVMMSRFVSHQMGTDTVMFYGVNVTEADVIMSDGKSLEKTGVMPDQMLLPSAVALATNADPVLAIAIEMAGSTIDPGEAGKLFPLEWPK